MVFPSSLPRPAGRWRAVCWWWRSARQRDDRRSEVWATDGAGGLDQTLGEVAVDALRGALAVALSGQPGRGREARQVVAGDDEGGEALEVVVAAVAGAAGPVVHRDEDEGPVGARRRQHGLARGAGGDAGVVVVDVADVDGGGAVAGRV